MKPLLRAFLCAALAAPTYALPAERPSPPPAAHGPAAATLAGDYAGTWQASGSDSGGKLRLKLRQAGETWTADAVFTFEGADVPTKMRTVRVDGAKIELVFAWEINGAPGESRLSGEFAGGRLHGRYESRTAEGVTGGNWSVTRM